MKESARYAKIVEWSEEDQCFVGSSPGLIYGGCHGPDEKAVFEELCQVVEKAIAVYQRWKTSASSYFRTRFSEQAAKRRVAARSADNARVD